jgi:hypothetical protein
MINYKELWHKKYSQSTVEFGFNAVAGHTAGLVVEERDGLCSQGNKGLKRPFAKIARSSAYISRPVSAQIAGP